MNTWIVTGGVTCGKSSFCRIVEKMCPNVEVFDCDGCVHELLTRSSIVRRISQAIGRGVVDREGGIDRSRLRELVFGDPASRLVLEQILHPVVYNELSRAHVDASSDGGIDLFVADVPLFFESAPQGLKSDQVLVVAASRGVQVRRIEARSQGRIDRALAAEIVDAQMGIEHKVDRADRTLWNDGCRESFERQAARLLELKK